MKTSSIFTVLLLCLLAGTGALAQSNTDSTARKGRWGVEGRADKISDKISREVGLNKEQHHKIYVINEDIIRRMDVIRANKSLSRKERLQQLKTLDTERNQRFKTVFTAAQYKKWNDWDMYKKEHLEEKVEKKRQRKENRESTQH
ncbi:MAG TPA: hypothetical protein VM802_00900 [Chitinophaga sp.]|uniref:hypothetical protein n=1 Tax=Chitinophaga sp. TaxID=1869181 RepID=UPI002CADC1C9|nr:hypothetical protein [Chitinophaga sp.]HVI43389.1 hypothetical protein [Chitinophaga sp.]